MAAEPLPLGRVVERPPLDPSVLSVRVGLLGCGTVGSEVARQLLDGFERGVHRFELDRVAVRDRDKTRPLVLPPRIVTTDALSIVKDPEIDVVVTDIAMPDVDGYALARTVRQRREPIPVIALSALTRIDAADEVLFDAFVRKPADPRAIAWAIHDAAEKHEGA